MRLLGTMKVSHYIFMVPRYESARLLQHATTKATEVVSWCLPFIAPDFRVFVETDDDYDIERGAVFPAPRALLDFAQPSRQEVTAWLDGNYSLVAKAREKLTHVGMQDGPGLDRYLEALLRQFLASENALDSLRTTLPDQWQEASRCKSSKEDLLALEYPTVSERGEKELVKRIAHDLAGELQRQAPALDEPGARAIAWGSVADWLMRCPLGWGPDA